MAAILYSELRKGAYIRHDRDLFLVLDAERRTPGNLPSKLRLMLKNLRTGAVTDSRVHPDDRVEPAFLDRRPVEYLYRDGADRVFMDRETFDQFPLPADVLAGALGFLREGDPATLVSADGEPLALELPATVELRVAETEPGVRGATASAVFKPAVLETGRRVTVPPFVAAGELVLIDTRTGEYAGRVRG